MGLTIHFDFLAPPGTDSAAAKRYVQQLHRFCLDRPFADVGAQLAHLVGEQDCDFEHSDRQTDPYRWMKIQARRQLVRRETLRHPDADDLRFGHRVGHRETIYYEVKPAEIIGFNAFPGAGCEPLEIGLGRYPDTITIWDRRHSSRARPRVLKTRLGGRWTWGAFCKTQYASEHSVPHFLRCHVLVIAVLDRAKELGILHRVSDEGDYWRKRRLDVLARQVGRYNAFIGAFAQVLKASVPPGQTVESEIENHPDYAELTLDRLSADFPELARAVRKTAEALRRVQCLA